MAPPARACSCPSGLPRSGPCCGSSPADQGARKIPTKVEGVEDTRQVLVLSLYFVKRGGERIVANKGQYISSARTRHGPRVCFARYTPQDFWRIVCTQSAACNALITPDHNADAGRRTTASLDSLRCHGLPQTVSHDPHNRKSTESLSPAHAFACSMVCVLRSPTALPVASAAVPCPSPRHQRRRRSGSGRTCAKR